MPPPVLLLLLRRRRRRKIAAGLAAAGAVGMGLLLLTVSMFGGMGTSPDALAAGCSAPTATSASPVPASIGALNSTQVSNAAAIVHTGQQLQIPARGWVIAVATAKQESDLVNSKTADDHDSLGLFQQRPSQGWGSPQQVTDPVYASGKFYEHLVKVTHWQTLPLTVAAQAVQRSAFPNAYARWEPLAKSVVTAIAGQVSGIQIAADEGQATCTNPDTSDAPALPDGPVGLMLAAALSRIGDPYVWGAVGPNAFDCSGLVVWSWRQAGYSIPIRTAAEMWHASNQIPAGQEQPGDLIFSNFGARDGLGPDDPGHVQIVVKPGLLVEAYDVGTPVRSITYKYKTGQRFGRFKPTVLRRAG